VVAIFWYVGHTMADAVVNGVVLDFVSANDNLATANFPQSTDYLSQLVLSVARYTCQSENLSSPQL
jgi:hypothetical protein